MFTCEVEDQASFACCVAAICCWLERGVEKLLCMHFRVPSTTCFASGEHSTKGKHASSMLLVLLGNPFSFGCLLQPFLVKSLWRAFHNASQRFHRQLLVEPFQLLH